MLKEFIEHITWREKGKRDTEMGILYSPLTELGQYVWHCPVFTTSCEQDRLASYSPRAQGTPGCAAWNSEGQSI